MQTTDTWYWPSTWYYSPWYVVPTPTPRPIKLTLAEVERLRAAARKDKALKAVLAKFTDLIEVAVTLD